MQKHNCKLCLKSFANGRALGGHLRSHMLNLYVTPKPKPPPHSPSPSPSMSSSSVSSSSEEIKIKIKTKTKTKTKTELSRNPTVRQRSKRIPRPESSWFGDQQYFHEINRIKSRNRSQDLKKSKTAGSSTPVSSVSDSSPEEAVAYCLMMLSRDKWTNDNESESESESESDREVITAKQTPTRNVYRCETCNRVFRSYQALGGHIASHKKIKLNHQFQFHHNSNQQTVNASSIDDKIHECHVCFKVFASGQALGGHKRSHVTSKQQVVKQSIDLIDLNLPAPSDVDDEVSKIEVSDGEFGKSC